MTESAPTDRACPCGGNVQTPSAQAPSETKQATSLSSQSPGPLTLPSLTKGAGDTPGGAALCPLGLCV